MTLPEGVKPKYGIFTTDRKFAEYTIDGYIRSHNCPVVKRVKSAYENYAVMEDGTKYEWIKPNDSSRGHKCSIGVIDLATCDISFIREWMPLICIFAEKKDYVFKDSQHIADSEPYNLYTLIDRLQKIEAVLGIVNKVGFYDLEYGWQRITSISADENEITFDTDC